MTAIASNPAGPIVPFIVIVHPKVFMVGCLAMVNLRHYWRITGKIPSSYHSSAVGSGLVTSASEGRGGPGLSSETSAEESEGPGTPKVREMGLVRGFSGPRESQIEYGFDVEMGEKKMLEGMKGITIKQPGEY